MKKYIPLILVLIVAVAIWAIIGAFIKEMQNVPKTETPTVLHVGSPAYWATLRSVVRTEVAVCCGSGEHTVCPSDTPGDTPTGTPTPSCPETGTPTEEVTGSPTVGTTASATLPPGGTVTSTQTRVVGTPSSTMEASATPSPVDTATRTVTISIPTLTETVVDPTVTPTPTGTELPTIVPSVTPTGTYTATPSATPTEGICVGPALQWLIHMPGTPAEQCYPCDSDMCVRGHLWRGHQDAGDYCVAPIVSPYCRR